MLDKKKIIMDMLTLKSPIVSVDLKLFGENIKIEFMLLPQAEIEKIMRYWLKDSEEYLKKLLNDLQDEINSMPLLLGDNKNQLLTYIMSILKDEWQMVNNSYVYMALGSLVRIGDEDYSSYDIIDRIKVLKQKPRELVENLVALYLMLKQEINNEFQKSLNDLFRGAGGLSNNGSVIGQGRYSFGEGNENSGVQNIEG